MDLKVLYEDNHLLVVEKIPNILSQADDTNDVDMISICKEYLKKKYNKPGNVFLGLVHRLDRPVGGAMVFARTSKAASRLSEQVRTRAIGKTYNAVVLGKCDKSGEFIDYLQKNKKTNIVKVVKRDEPEAKLAKLSYRLIESCYSTKDKKEYSLVEVDLHTGRPHQIRVQFSSRNHPLFGDQRYSKYAIVGEQIALWSTKLALTHPVSKEKMVFISNPPDKYPWNLFEEGRKR